MILHDQGCVPTLRTFASNFGRTRRVVLLIPAGGWQVNTVQRSSFCLHYGRHPSLLTFHFRPTEVCRFGSDAAPFRQSGAVDGSAALTGRSGRQIELPVYGIVRETAVEANRIRLKTTTGRCYHRRWPFFFRSARSVSIELCGA
jgi:hypothetical protein